jgi:hypothetical protein
MYILGQDYFRKWRETVRSHYSISLLSRRDDDALRPRFPKALTSREHNAFILLTQGKNLKNIVLLIAIVVVILMITT